MKKHFLRRTRGILLLAVVWAVIFQANSALHRRAHSLLLEGDTERAVSVIRKVITLEPNFFLHRGAMGKRNLVAAFRETGDILSKRKHRVIPGNGAVLASPAAGADGFIYLAAGGDTVMKTKVSGGAPAWTYTTGGVIETRILPADGKVFVAAHDGLHVIDSETGEGRLLHAIRWGESSPAYASGAIFIGSDSGRLLKLNSVTGDEIWSFGAAGPVESSPSVHGGAVFVGCNKGEVYSLNADTGTLIWKRIVGGRIEGRPFVSGGSVYVGTSEGIVFSLDSATGKSKWIRDAGGGIVSSVAGAGGTVVAGTMKGDVLALDAEDGHILWTFRNTGPMEADPAIYGGVVYIGTHYGFLHALDMETGKKLWSFLAGWDIDESSALVYDGYVIFGSMDGNNYVIGIAD